MELIYHTMLKSNVNSTIVESSKVISTLGFGQAIPEI